ncbi:MAG: glycogen debranching enzyme N-terminal domain-containing protein [Bacteroides sp.]
MSYLRFDRTLMTNLEESLPREVLRTNKSGAYHCTTIVDCNTRKYHGLLVIPIPELGDKNHVLLSSLDETVIQHGAEFNLGLHEYQGGHFSPNGHKYIREFSSDIIPATTYRVGGVVLKKEKLFVHHEHRILIRYTLLNAHSKTTLRFRPFLAFRKVTTTTHENDAINKHYDEIDCGIKTSLYPAYPELCMQFNKKVDFHFVPDWYRNFQYRKEIERGYDYKEDLYVPGYFELPIQKGESIVFSAGITEIAAADLLDTFQVELNERTPRDSFEHCLVNSAHQFYKKQGDRNYIVAAYPWYLKQRARDLFVSLPGLTLATGHCDWFEAIMDTARIKLEAFMQAEQHTQELQGLADADVLLWVIWAIQQYAKSSSLAVCKEKYFDLVSEIISYIRSHKHPNLFLHANGLLYTKGGAQPVTWMNAVVNGKPVTARSGYIVEVNGLWYNALRFIESMYLIDNTKEVPVPKFIQKIISLLESSFPAVFINEYGYLYDYVDGDVKDLSVRPNMIIPVGLDFSPLDKKQMKAVLDTVTKELLTPKGLRSLSPKSLGYNPVYEGSVEQRAYAYHQGTAWPWLMGFYAEAYLKINKRSGVSFIERQLIGYDSDMSNHCIGSLSELYDGNPPFRGRGAISFAMNTAEILRVLRILSNYYLE